MKNIFFLLLAIVFFAIAAYAYWIVARETGVTPDAATSPSSPPATRSLSPRSVGPPPSGLMTFIKEWQPVLSLVSSVGGIVSFLFQLRIWMRSRA